MFYKVNQQTERNSGKMFTGAYLSQALSYIAVLYLFIYLFIAYHISVIQAKNRGEKEKDKDRKSKYSPK